MKEENGSKQPSPKIKVSDDAIWTDVEGTGIIVDLSTGEYYETNSVGLDCLNLLKENKTINDIVKQIASDYGADMKEVEKDIGELLDALKERKIIIASND